MIGKADLEQQLEKLNQLYLQSQANGSPDPDLEKYYSRLAVLELGSWVEDCMDDLAMLHPSTHLNPGPELNSIKDTVDSTHGFDYDENFRKLMKKIVGVVALYHLEDKMDAIKKGALKAALTKIYPERNDHAHKPIRNTTSFTAPSLCISLLDDIYKGFVEFEEHLKKIRAF